jgi:hypothetical protein
MLKTLYVAINRVAARPASIEPFVAEHLAYMNALETEGRHSSQRSQVEGRRP